ncbi:MAG: D-(-)-3-hydroxybutyrate oligomer hydrolase [Rhodospirillales bacterium]|nr:D-(-)-3-hydroxybutyrate oligomer hydrolase [Rhodospirillales bacterium]MDH3791215.1 D-(-)-3-hydroxybutyrate oligomer hydrolase [Rhodospirillales bacterium]MDH3912313.1 D-(-)-3-hydroxybutyrate oligomer hydrolase [Rhodospirillales bacterium]MDH3918464.1 D-(-)-3-hydroxybutyrate oligomer hydrolase [Rhodospirillales bacterium]MDH3967917.1 D-(-)-3-hydroxybutyrate oligomer hydrolase [Rhodospirillales bacterium]
MTFRKCLLRAIPISIALAGLGTAQAGERPNFILGEISRTVYDGVSDDLLTGGLGKDGLAFAAPAPGFTDPENPTPAELRRLAIYNNYRALVDTTEGGGYGVLYGPNVTADGVPTSGQGLVAGVEHIAYAGNASGKVNVTMMVQLPDSFDPASPCIVTAPSSGSRGVYGAIGTAGEWGLKNGCAVAYTEKGTGTGAHDLQDDTVNLITGERAGADEAGKDSTFTAKLGAEQQDRFNAATPDRFAFKHAHSRRNPEKDWGRDVLRSIDFAFFVLGQEYPGASIAPGNTIVIASSVSNGGGASILAAEQDAKGLIDGVAVSEPNINPTPGAPFRIVQGDGPPLTAHSRNLYDYTTLLNAYQGCASVAFPPFALFNFAPSPDRCATLHDKGLLAADTLADQAIEAQAVINDYGILPEQNIVQPSHWFLFVPQAISVTYANAYGRVSVTDNLCAYSFAATGPDGAPVPLSTAAEAALFSTSNGIPPTGGVNLVNNAAPEGPKEDRGSTPDQNLDGALCLRGLSTGADPVTGALLAGKAAGFAERIAEGIGEILAGGDLNGTPTLIVTGRSDAILPPNHTSRAYVGLNQVVEGAGSKLRYYEVLNAQHLDVLNAFGGFDERFVPLHHYFIGALDMMLDHLRNGTPLPPSQVVRTTPRGPGAPPISLANLPPIAAAPDPGSAITFAAGILRIPE